jgi:hypothetical protein
MISKLLKTLIALSLPALAQAQFSPAGTIAPYKTAQGQRILAPRKAGSTARITASDPVSGFAHYIYTSGSPRLNDSAAFTWSGGRTSVQYSQNMMADVVISDFDQEQSFMNLGGSILPDLKTNNTYNTTGKVIGSLIQRWNSSGGIWVNKRRSSYTYTGTKTVMTEESWNIGTLSWENNVRITIDSVAGIKDETYESWDGSKWANEYHYQYHYSGANITESVSQEWKSGTWENVRREANTYAGSDITEILTQMWDVTASAWENAYRTQVIYALGPGLSSEYKSDEWNSSTSSWDSKFRGLNTWTAGKLTGQTDQSWDESAGSWQDVGQSSYTYSSSGDVRTYVAKTWNFISMSWEDNYRFDFDYNSGNQLTRVLFSQKAGGGGSLEKQTENFYYYVPTTGIAEDKGMVRNTRLYPNQLILP